MELLRESMETKIESFLHLIDYALHGGERKSLDYINLTINDAYSMAKQNTLTPILYNAVAEIYSSTVNQDVLQHWRGDTTYYALRQTYMYHEIKRIIEEAEKRMITLVFFKGCILADLYPQYSLRISSDTDIYVSRDQVRQADKLLEDLGYEQQEQGSKDVVPVYYCAKTRHKIELHYSIYEDLKGSKISEFEMMDLVKKSSLIKLNVCNGIAVTTLGYTEHLIYQFFHIAKHFCVEGVGIRYVIDIILYVNRYYDKIDWNEFWKKIATVKYEGLTQYIFSIGIQYFQLTKKAMENRQILTKEEVQPIIEDLIARGEVVKKKNADWQILGAMTPYFAGDVTVSESKFLRRMKVIFPSPKLLSKDYYYAQRHKWLLPIAWFHRWIKFTKRRLTARDDWYSRSEKLKIIDHRLSLMKLLGLTNNKKETR